MHGFGYIAVNRSASADIYTGLPPINNQRVKLTSSTPFTPTYVKNNVTRSSDPAQIYASRVQGRQILLDNPARESRAQKERETKKARRLENKARSEIGVVGKKRSRAWKLTQSRFSSFLPLHHLWLDYMSELLILPPSPNSPELHVDFQATTNAASMHAKLVKADFHGSIMIVRQSKNPCLVALSGIVIHETENAFKIVTEKNQLKLIPKQNSIFAFAVPLYSTTAITPARPTADSSMVIPRTAPPDQVRMTVLDMPHIQFELYGNQFCFRSADRASRKFKPKETIEL